MRKKAFNGPLAGCVNIAALFAISVIGLLSACKHAATSSESSVPGTGGVDVVQLPEEPYPFNSVPLSVLKADESGFFAATKLPAIVEVPHHADLQPHGVRYLPTLAEVTKYVKPGDVFIMFEPILADQNDPMMIVQKGMYHAGLVIANRTGGKDLLFTQGDGEVFLCHLDTTAGHDPSGCTFDGPHHFFRITEHSQTSAAMHYADLIFANWSYDFFFNLDLDAPDKIATVASALEGGKKMSLYCSELPFTVHGLANKQLLFTPVTIASILSDWNQFVDRYHSLYHVDLTNQAVSKAIVYYFATFLPPHVQTIVDNTMVRRYVANALSAPAGDSSGTMSIAAKKMAPPWTFMDEAKRGNPDIHYIGTYYPGQYKALALPMHLPTQLPQLSALIESTDAGMIKASNLLPGSAAQTIIEGEPTGTRTKIGRLLHWVRTRPQPVPSATTFFAADKRRTEILNALRTKLAPLMHATTLEYQDFVDVCDQMNLYSTEYYNAHKALLSAMSKVHVAQAVINSTYRDVQGFDTRLQWQFESFGCGMAAKYLLEPAAPDAQKIKEIQAQ